MQGTKPDNTSYNDSHLNSIIEQNAASMRKGLIEFAVMSMCASKPLYVGQMVASLSESGLNVVEGTLYPLLSRLHKTGQVEYEWQESDSGPPRKYYKLTDAGRRVLVDYSKQWKDLKKAIAKLEKGVK